MVKKLFVAISLMFTVMASHAATAEVSIAAVKKYVLSVLKDPESARFYNVQAFNDNTIVCGYVNAKNSYGGYTGKQVFLVSFDSGRPAVAWIDKDDEDRAMFTCTNWGWKR